MANKNQTPEQPRLFLEKALLLSIISSCRTTLHNRGNTGFVEMGGALLGYVDDEGWHATQFVQDEGGSGSAGSFRFTPRFFASLARQQGSADLLVLGSWHSHPPGYGTQMSATDYDMYAQDRIMLSADRVRGEFPRCHIIVDLDKPDDVAAYSCELSTHFALEPVDYPEEQPACLFSSAETDDGVLLKAEDSGDLKAYPGDMPIPDADRPRLAGIYRRLRVLERFFPSMQALVFENYSKHTSQSNFLFACQGCDGSSSLVRVRRQSSGPTELSYRSVYIALKGETPSMDGQFNVRVLDDLDHSITVASLSPTDCVRDLVLAFCQQRDLEQASVLPTLMLAGNVPPNLADDLPRVPGRAHARSLPEDMTISSLVELAPAAAGDRIVMRRTAASAEDVYFLRTRRMEQCGYDLEMLRAARVTIGGCGILGCEIAEKLAVAGVGCFDLIDFGHVDWVNLRRQSLYDQSTIYQPKAESAAAKLQAFGGIEVRPLQLAVPALVPPGEDPLSLEAFRKGWRELVRGIEGSTLVVGGFDGRSARMTLQAASASLGIPFMATGVGRTGGLVLLNADRSGACYFCERYGALTREHDRGDCTVVQIPIKMMTCTMAIDMALLLLHGKDIPEPSVLIGQHLGIRKRTLLPSDECPFCGDGGMLNRAKGDCELLGDLLYEWFQSVPLHEGLPPPCDMGSENSVGEQASTQSTDRPSSRFGAVGEKVSLYAEKVRNNVLPNRSGNIDRNKAQ